MYIESNRNIEVIDDENIKIYNVSDKFLIIPDERKVFINGRNISLITLEYDLLVYLFKHCGQILSYMQIYEAVWKEPYAGEKGNIMTHIRHLREKIESDPSQPRYIENIRGVGYRFKKQ